MIKKILFLIFVLFSTIANAQTVHDCRIHHLSFAIQRFDNEALIKIYFVAADGSNLNSTYCPDQNGPTLGTSDFAVYDVTKVGASYAFHVDRNLGLVHFNVATVQGHDPQVFFYEEFEATIN